MSPALAYERLKSDGGKRSRKRSDQMTSLSIRQEPKRVAISPIHYGRGPGGAGSWSSRQTADLAFSPGG